MLLFLWYGTWLRNKISLLWLEYESFEPLIYLLAHRETKLWLKHQVFGKTLKLSKNVTLAISVQLWPVVVGCQIELECYSNPLKTRLVKKTIFRIFFGHFGPWLHDWRMFFEYSCDVIRGSKVRILWLKVLLDPGLEYKFLETLIDFLAFLVPKLDRKEPNILQIC